MSDLRTVDCTKQVDALCPLDAVVDPVDAATPVDTDADTPNDTSAHMSYLVSDTRVPHFLAYRSSN
jgi:hypothetical protein